MYKMKRGFNPHTRVECDYHEYYYQTEIASFNPHTRVECDWPFCEPYIPREIKAIFAKVLIFYLNVKELILIMFVST